MIRIPVTTPSRSYEVLIGSGLLARAGESLGSLLASRRAFVVTVAPVRRRWAKVLVQSLKAAGIETSLLEMPDGEPAKRLTTLENLADQLVKAGRGSRNHADCARWRGGRRRNWIPRLDLYARSGCDSGADDRAGAGGRGDRGQDWSQSFVREKSAWDISSAARCAD